MKALRILLVDDHKVVREGLKYILSGQSEFDIETDEAEDKNTAVYKASVLSYDIILMDINLNGESGIDATKEILSKNPKQKIIALSMHNEEHKIQQMIQRGAKGYILKNTGNEELLKAIKTVMNGQSFFSNEVALTLMGMAPAQTNKLDDPMVLTKREIEVLRLIAEEYTNEEIGQELKLSKRTIDSHRQKMLIKLDLRNTAGLIRYAMRHGIIS